MLFCHIDKLTASRMRTTIFLRKSVYTLNKYESPVFEAVPARHERPIDVRTLWSLDSGLQLPSVSTTIARSLFPCLSANFVFTLHQAAFIAARRHMAKIDVALDWSK
jgi:hypothetical protein